MQVVGHSVVLQILRPAQFFLLEAGFIGFAILAIRRSWQVGLALVVLAVLPVIRFGPNNDLVMRASIPSLAVLAIGACQALLAAPAAGGSWRRKALLGGLLAVGAVTPLHEFARAVLLPVWPVNLAATLVGADCGNYPAHYVARLGAGPTGQLLRAPHALSAGAGDTNACTNPALFLMWQGGLL
jgi:hypothetical protein